MKVLVLLLCLSLGLSAYPTVVFHGLNDSCQDREYINEILRSELNTYVVCLETGAAINSVVGHSMTEQAELGCQMINQDPKLKGQTINVVGQSQGSIIARYITQKCEFGGRVATMLTMGGPMQGTNGVPSCDKTQWWCNYLDYLIGNLLIYNSLVQNYVAPAAYYKDTYHLQSYLAAEPLLAQLNNEVQFDQNSKDRMAALDQLVLIKFSMDEVIIPKESAWFQYDKENSNDLLAMEDTPLYKQDLIGLQSLHKNNKIIKETIDRPHMHVYSGDVSKVVVPYLL